MKEIIPYEDLLFSSFYNSNGITIEKNVISNHTLVEKKGSDIRVMDINNEYCLEV